MFALRGPLAVDWTGHSGLLLAFAASLLAAAIVAWLGLGWCRRSRSGGGSRNSSRSKSRQPPKRKALRPRRRLGWALGAVAALAAALAARRWRLGGAVLPLSARCAHHRFTYRRLGRPLKTEVAISEGQLCCYYGGRDYATAEAAASVPGPRQSAASGGGVRVAHLPETHPLDACGVAQLAMDAHRITLDHPTRLSAAMRAVRDYEAAAVRDNSVRQVASEPFGYFATRDLKPGDEVTSAFGASYWLKALLRHEERPAARLLLCVVQAQYERMMQGVDAVSECTTLRDATGDTMEFVFSTKAQAVVLRSGEISSPVLSEMSEMQAGGFIVRFLRVGVKSSGFWPSFAEVDEPATTKLRKLVRHLVTDGLTTDAPSEFAEGS